MVIAVVFGLVGAGVLVALGLWQMQRLAWKEGVLAEIEARIGAAPVAVPAVPDAGDDLYLPVVAEGVIGDARLRVLVSTKFDGPGYRIIAPFDTGGRVLMLDRGFLAVDEAVPEGGAALVTGNLHWPDEITGSTPAPDLDADIWFARDVPAMAEALGAEPVLIIARDVVPASAIRPMPVGTEGIPNDHLQYAITWFSLALIWIGMTLYLLWRINRRTI